MEYQLSVPTRLLEGRRAALRSHKIKELEIAGRLCHKLSCLLTRETK
jgi:hypothetical protein